MNKDQERSILKINSLNDVEIYSSLGEGSFGQVYKGKWNGVGDWNGKIVAIKKNIGQSAKDFLDEAEILWTSQHGNVVKFVAVCMSEYDQAIIMEYMDGGSLTNFINDSRKIDITWEPRYKIMIDLGRGLAFLHNAGVVHGDLKTGNILLDGKGNAKLADFGFSKIKLKKENISITLQGKKAGGSLNYLAPELFEQVVDLVRGFGEKAETTQKTDIYSYGLVLWTITTHKQPYIQESYEKLDEFKRLICIEKKREIIDPDTPPDLKKVLEKCWSHNPEIRPSAEETWSIIDSLANNLPEEESECERALKPDRPDINILGRLFETKPWALKPIFAKLPGETVMDILYRCHKNMDLSTSDKITFTKHVSTCKGSVVINFFINILKEGELTLVETFIKNKIIDVHWPLDENKNTAIHLAVLHNQQEIAKALINMKANPTKWLNIRNHTAEKIAKMNGDQRFVDNLNKWYTEAKDQRYIHHLQNSGSTSFFALSSAQAIKVCLQNRFIIEILKGNIDEVKKLYIEKGAMLTEADENGLFPLVAAARNFTNFKTFKYIIGLLGDKAKEYLPLVEEEVKKHKPDIYPTGGVNYAWLANWYQENSEKFWCKKYDEEILKISGFGALAESNWSNRATFIRKYHVWCSRVLMSDKEPQTANDNTIIMQRRGRKLIVYWVENKKISSRSIEEKEILQPLPDIGKESDDPALIEAITSKYGKGLFKKWEGSHPSDKFLNKVLIEFATPDNLVLLWPSPNVHNACVNNHITPLWKNHLQYVQSLQQQMALEQGGLDKLTQEKFTNK
jgi:serine/threonine protein kinase